MSMSNKKNLGHKRRMTRKQRVKMMNSMARQSGKFMTPAKHRSIRWMQYKEQIKKRVWFRNLMTKARIERKRVEREQATN